MNTRTLFTTLFLITLTTFAKSQTFCVPTISGSGYFIDNFAFHTLVNTNSGVTSVHYYPYPASIYTATVSLGKSYPITVSDRSTSGTYGKYAAWIDFNNDSLFDASECVFYDTLHKHSGYGMVSIPNNPAFVGLRRMRVLNAYSSGSLSPCGTYNDGEAEDYTISIVTNQPYIQTYGMPFYPHDSKNFIINNFHLASITNDNSGTNADGYTFYTSNAFTTDLALNSVYPIFISKGTTAGITGGYGLWIDLNNNGNFDSTEQLLSSGPNLTSINYFIVIPNNSSYTGKRRLRIRSGWGIAPATPYGLFSDGEAEDYTVNIIDPVSVPNQNGQGMTVSLYPNPSAGSATVYCDKIIDDLKVVSVTGQFFFQSSPHTKSSILQITQPGVYIITVHAGDKILTGRLIVM